VTVLCTLERRPHTSHVSIARSILPAATASTPPETKQERHPAMAWQSPSAHNPQDGSGQGGNNGVGQGQGGGNGPQALGTEYTLQGTGCSDQYYLTTRALANFGARVCFRCDAIFANGVAPSRTGSELLGD